MKKIVLTCVLVFSACCVTLLAQKDKKEKETVKIECCCEDCTCRSVNAIRTARNAEVVARMKNAEVA